MRLGLNTGYWDSASAGVDRAALVRHAESLGYDSVWTAEAYGSDAVVPLTWIAARTTRIKVGTAILQMPARSPAMAAMTAATLDHLSEGRLLLGLGVSGPQVVEGWHGQPYGKPLERTREYVGIVRAILARERPVEHHGTHYDMPYSGPGATGLGKPLRLIIRPRRADIPIYLAAIGPKNVALAAEIGDGWLPIFFSPGRYRESFAEALKATREGFDIAPTVAVVLGDDVDACRAALKPNLALYIGGMGAKGKNFYNDLARRYGFEEAAEEIQGHYLEGRKGEAAAAVPDALVDEVALCGPRERIAERLELWRDSGLGTLIVASADPATLETMAELAL